MASNSAVLVLQWLVPSRKQLSFMEGTMYQWDGTSDRAAFAHEMTVAGPRRDTFSMGSLLVPDGELLSMEIQTLWL